METLKIMKKEKIFLSWEDIEKMIEKLYYKIQLSHPQISSITGLPRGGLIPAVMLSHKLNIPFINAEELNLYNKPKFSLKDKSILVIDDICDSGKTLQYIIPKYLTATLYHKPNVSTVTPDIYCSEVKENEWIVYPWEREDSKMVQDYLK